MNELGGNYYLFVKENRNGAQFSDDEDFGINIDFNLSNCTMKEASYQNDIIKQMIEEQEIDYD